MDLEPDVVALLAVVASGLAGLLLLGVAVLALRLRTLRRTYRIALGGETQDVFQAVRDQGDTIASLRDDLGVIHGNTEHLRDLHRSAVSRVGLVRYDAFPDMGGMLSFSAALLDEQGNGLVVSAINGRQETRSYGKPVTSGSSDHNLSDEEQDAIRAALERGPGTAITQPGRRRRGSRKA